MQAAHFIEKWKGRDGNEIGNTQSFLNDLCDLLQVPQPHDPEDGGTREEYSFERPVTFKHNNGKTSIGRIDLYRRGSFVLEAKQGSEQKARIADPRQHELITGEPLTKQAAGMAVRGTPSWTAAMLKAKGQAYAYARALDASEGWPPFLIVVDIGHVIDLYADFSGAGKNYTPYPDGTRYRLDMDSLGHTKTLELLRAVWLDPQSLDPTAKSAQVTRQISDELAALGRSFHEQGHDPETTSRFLMRCLFTMFAEDVELIPRNSFTNLLIEMRGQPENASLTLEALWQGMDKGGFSPVLRKDLLRFNGGLFAESKALPVNAIQLGLLIRAAEQDWREVEPAIFGTLLERALSPKDRHKLGAHFTPRTYVERLVTPTVMEPLRGDWMDVQAAALTLQEEDRLDDAIDTVREFLAKLCNVRVLDPACGSGNFLYIALEGMKRLEGEVKDFLIGLGDTQMQAITVDPHQFLGIEKNPWAAAVAELVLWIGYLQWHFRTFGKATPSEPVLRDFHNIEHRDALLVLDGEHPRLDESGKPVTRWDGETMKRHHATDQLVPDESAQVVVMNYDGAKAAAWPSADFIVGNPPFIGASRMRDALGDGYTETLWRTYGEMPESADFVLFWWYKAAKLQQSASGPRRFGFITTNSLRQTFARRVLEVFLNDQEKPLSLVFAIPDHPWVDSADGAAVRIAMTVAASGKRSGRVLTVKNEEKRDLEAEGLRVTFKESRGVVFANLQTGVDLSAINPLKSNEGLAIKGMQLNGQGFLLDASEAASLIKRNSRNKSIILPYVNGKDVSQINQGRLVIDAYPRTQLQLQKDYPEVYQILLDRVKPERDLNRDPWRKENWHWFGRTHETIRKATAQLDRFIVTTRTAKHRIFSFVSGETIAESKLVVIASDCAQLLAVLSSKAHGIWCLAQGSFLEDRPNYNHTECFNPFPFPPLNSSKQSLLKELGERLDFHRKRQQEIHPKLTLTSMYNVLEKLRSGETIEGRDREIYEQGLIAVLKDIHDQIDAEVSVAYGWSADASDEEILAHLVSLNLDRQKEEARGQINWLRPKYQNPSGQASSATDTGTLDLGEVEQHSEKYDWPKAMPLQVSFVRNALADMGEGDAESVARHFKRAPRKTVRDILESLAALGHVRQIGKDKFAT